MLKKYTRFFFRIVLVRKDDLTVFEIKDLFCAPAGYIALKNHELISNTA